MLVMMKCVAEAVVAKGVKGLAEIVPGGQYLFDVANEALKRMRDRKRATELRAEVLAAAQATNEEAKQIAAQVAREVAAGAPPEDRLALEMYLTQIPGVVRQSLKRADDPSGRSVPDGFALNDAADLLKRLPSRPAKFRPGDPLPGKPGWQLVELLGTGGFGEVWLARNPSLSALKGAVKFGLDPQARDRLLRHEGALVNRVMEEGKHPNVVQLLDAHLDGDAPWLMYEYVPGGDLTGLILTWQSLPADERAKRTIAALQTLASAVGHFHRLRPPLVHRDLKPANILVSGIGYRVSGIGKGQESDGGSGSAPIPDTRYPIPDLKVSDLGIGGVAAVVSLAENATRRSSVGYLASQLWGSHTPLYASPQQQRGDAPDPRDDVHALGVIGFQMLTGKLDATLGADYAKTLRRLSVPEPLIELLGDCAAHDLDNRPADAADLAAKLAALGAAKPPPPPPVRARPVAAPVPEPPPALPKNLRGARPVVAFRYEATNADGDEVRGTVEASDKKDAALKLKNRGLFITTLTQVGGPDDDRRPGRLPDDHEPVLRGRGFARGLLLTIGLVFAVCMGIPLAIFYFGFPGGAKTPFVQTGPENTDPGERKVEKSHTLTGAKGRTTDLFFAPDGLKVAAVSDDGEVTVWEGGGSVLNWGGTSRVKGHRPAFSSVSTRFAVGNPAKSPADRIDIFAPFDGFDRSEFRTGLADRPLRLAFSPDGQWLVAGGESNGQVMVWDANKDGKPLQLSPDTGAATHTLDNQPCGIAEVVFSHGGKRLLTAGGDHVRLWKTDQWPRSIAPEVSFTHSGRITAAGIDPDPRCRWCGAGGANGVVRVWELDAAAGKLAGKVPPNVAAQVGQNKVYEQTKTNLGAVKQLAFSSFRYVAALDGTGFGYVWEARWNGSTPARPTPIDWHGKGVRVNAVAFNPEGSLLATAGDDKAVRFWDQFWGKPHEARIECDAAVTAIAFSPDGNRLAAACANGTVTVWQVPNPKKRLGD